MGARAIKRKRAAVANAAAHPDPLVDVVELVIDDKTYKLAYDFVAIADAEGLINKYRAGGDRVNLLHGIAGLFTLGVDATQLLGLFSACLKLHQPKMALADAGRLIRFDTTPSIFEAIKASYIAYLPTKKQLAQNPSGDAAKTGDAAPTSR